MHIIRAKDLSYIPASHEDPQNPSVYKKVLFKGLEEGKIQMINWAKLPVGKSFKAHYHENMDEIYIMMDGITTMVLDNEEVVLEKGDALLVPMKSVHKLVNKSDEDVHYIVLGVSRGDSGKTVAVEG